MAKKNKKAEVRETGYLALVYLKKVVAIYIFMMLAVYPLYYQDKYFNMGEAKWIFFKNVSLFFSALALVGVVAYMSMLIFKGEIVTFFKNAKKNMVVTDWFVLAYLIVCVISALATPYKEIVLIGYDGWYMGLLSQVGFVMIYFFVSRLWRWDGPAVMLYLGIAAVVFLFGIVMRFHVDPMEMYLGLEENYIKNFLSTLGQATWYSSYMCILFPLGMYAFWLYDVKWKRIVFGIFTSISFMTLVTQNSDSAYLALVGILIMLFWISMESNKGFIRMLEVLLIAVGSFKFMGICQIIFADVVVELDSISFFISKSIFTWILLLVLMVIYIAARRMLKVDVLNAGDFDISKYKFVRWIVLGISAVLVLAAVIYIILNTTGMLPENLSSDNNYLLFDIHWGNNRGVSWKAAVYTIIHSDIVRKLIGAGPDCFAMYVYTFEESAAAIRSIFGKSVILTCCHNEWLNSFINVGIIGGISYIGIFVCSIKRCMSNLKLYPETYAVAISVMAYIFHNFFCYQQIICTPIIFILMGGAEALVRNGYCLEEWEK